MKNFKLFLPALFLLCAFCKKDSPAQVELILANGTWYLEAYFTDDNEDGIFEDVIFPCQSGDGFNFSPNYQFEMRDEIEYCDTDVDSVFVLPGTWEMQENNTVVAVAIADGELVINYHIHSINDTLLELRIYESLITQEPQEERFVLRR